MCKHIAGAAGATRRWAAPDVIHIYNIYNPYNKYIYINAQQGPASSTAVEGRNVALDNVAYGDGSPSLAASAAAMRQYFCIQALYIDIYIYI